MTRILLLGISFLLLFNSCNSVSKLSKKVNKKFIEDSDGMVFYRDIKQNIQVRYLGDYETNAIRGKKLNAKLKIYNLKIAKTDKIILFAKTNIPPFYESCLIQAKDINEYTKKIVLKKVNEISNNLIYIDTQNIAHKRYLFAIWASEKGINQIKEIRDSMVINNFLLEAKLISNSIETAKKKFNTDISDIANEAFSDTEYKRINYLNPLLLLNYYLSKDLTESEHHLLLQLLATYHSFIGNNDSTQLYTQKAFTKQYAQLKNNDKNLILASKKIEELAQANNLLLFNEAHTDYRNRVFLKQMLPMLFANGYRILAIEGVSAFDTLLNTRKYPTNQTGFYTREPNFASLIRDALELGFKIFPYDASPDCSKCNNTDANCCFNLRELAQASNLRNIIENNQKSKIIIYGGHDHIYKKTPSDKIVTMAMQLINMGYHFASIDQVRGNFYFINKKRQEYLSVIDNKLLPEAFTKLLADAYIIPPYSLENKPNSTKPYIIKFNTATVLKKSRLYIKIYNSNDDINEIPIPLVVSEIKKGRTNFKVFLPKGSYTAIVSSRSKEIFKHNFTVD
jgi:hypothetical protein